MRSGRYCPAIRTAMPRWAGALQWTVGIVLYTPKECSRQSSGATDLIVVSTVDAVLVASREHLPAIKGIVERLQAEGAREAIAHRRDLRPWGHIESIDEGFRFAVKRLVVDPGEALSVHRHMHRAEHWIVVKGTASAVIDGVARTLAEDESLYVPMATAHRLSNRGP